MCVGVGTYVVVCFALTLDFDFGEGRLGDGRLLLLDHVYSLVDGGECRAGVADGVDGIIFHGG